MRKLIAALKVSADGKIEGANGLADWVEAWSDDYGLSAEIDACLLGGRMYPGYEQYWTAIQNEPDTPLQMTGKRPTPEEVAWSRFAATTPHYVLSNTLTAAAWPQTEFVRSLDDVATLKQQSGKAIYLMGGAEITASLIEADLVDELRLIVHPLIAGEGKALFAAIRHRHALDLLKVQQMAGGRVGLTYGIETTTRALTPTPDHLKN